MQRSSVILHCWILNDCLLWYISLNPLPANHCTQMPGHNEAGQLTKQKFDLCIQPYTESSCHVRSRL